MTDPKSWSLQRLSWLRHRLWWTRAVTLGVRAIVIKDDAIFLVRHTYIAGWFLPGGAVDPGESARTAVMRELREEGGIVCTQTPELHGFYRSKASGGRDHVACFVVRHFELEPMAAEWEIAEHGFFALDGLPEGTSQGTLARIAELFDGTPASEDW